MKKNELLSALLTGILSVLLFAVLTLFNLQHNIAFLMPVLLAVHVMRYNLKSGLIAATIMLLSAPAITHFLPLGEGSFIRGFVFMSAAIVVGFLHGGLSKTKILHSDELLIVMIADLLFGFLSVIVFSLAKDPHFEINNEFHHFYHTFSTLFNLKEGTIYTENIKYFFLNSWTAYLVCFSILEALLTHVFIHFVMKFMFKDKEAHSFSGLDFTLPKWAHIAFIISFVLFVGVFFISGLSLPPTLQTIIAIFINLMLSFQLLFSLYGILTLITIWGQKKRTNITFSFFILGLVLFPISALFGAIGGLFALKKKARAQYTDNSIDYLYSKHNN